MVTKKVEGSAEAVSLDYRGQSSRNPRDVGANPREDAWCPSHRAVMVSSVAHWGAINLYKCHPLLDTGSLAQGTAF